MDSMSSFKGYIIIVTISVVLIFAVVIAAVTATVIHNCNSSSSSPPVETIPGAPQLTPASSLKSVCDVTLYPDTCFSSISNLRVNNTSDPQTIFKLSLHVAIDEASKPKEVPARLQSKFTGNATRLFGAFSICEAGFDDAVDKLNESLAYMANSSDDKILRSDGTGMKCM